MFSEDLKYGHTGEAKVEQLFQSWNFKTKRPTGYHPDFDILLDNGKTVEVKTDRLALKTGNFAIEIYSINKSKADIFAYVIGNVIYLSPLPKVRDFANAYPYKKQTGDQPDNVSALIPKRQYIEFIKPDIFEV